MSCLAGGKTGRLVDHPDLPRACRRVGSITLARTSASGPARSDLVASDQRLLQLASGSARTSVPGTTWWWCGKRPCRPDQGLCRCPWPWNCKTNPGIPGNLLPPAAPAFKKWALLVPRAPANRRNQGQAPGSPGASGRAGGPAQPYRFQGADQELTNSLMGELFTGFLKEDQGSEKIPTCLPGGQPPGTEAGPGRRPALRIRPWPAFCRRAGGPGPRGLFLTENNKYLLFLVTPGRTALPRPLRRWSSSVKSSPRFRPDTPTSKPGDRSHGPGGRRDGKRHGGCPLATWLSLVSQLLLLVLFSQRQAPPPRRAGAGGEPVLDFCRGHPAGRAPESPVHCFRPPHAGDYHDFGVHWFCRLEEEQDFQARPTATP